MADTEPQPTPPTPSKVELPPPGGYALWVPSVVIVLSGLAVDHLTKWLSLVYLAPPPRGEGRVITLIPDWFWLRYAENRGAAFSILEGQTMLLTIVSLVASVALFWWWTRLPAREYWGRFAMAMVFSGAVGNLIDRIAFGYVVDMFDWIFFGKWDYPVFNVADSMIFCGVIVLVVRTLQGKM